MCYFNEKQTNVNAILEKSSKTSLTEWFIANQNYPETRHLKYTDFTDSYVWNNNLKEWSIRKQSNTMSRMFFVPANDSELYYLRLLLTHVSGALSFEDLRTINSVEFKTYKKAAIAYDLLQDDQEFYKCLKEAAEIQTGQQLRNLFCIILLHNTIQQPFLLWDKNKEYLCEDLLYKAQKE